MISLAKTFDQPDIDGYAIPMLARIFDRADCYRMIEVGFSESPGGHLVLHFCATDQQEAGHFAESIIDLGGFDVSLERNIVEVTL